MFHNIKIGAEKDCHIRGKKMKTTNPEQYLRNNKKFHLKTKMSYKDTRVDTHTHTHRPAELGNVGNWQESLQFSVSEYYTHMEIARGEIYP